MALVEKQGNKMAFDTIFHCNFWWRSIFPYGLNLHAFHICVICPHDYATFLLSDVPSFACVLIALL